MNYRLPYGKSWLHFTLPEQLGWSVQMLSPRAVPAARDPLAAIERALEAAPLPMPASLRTRTKTEGTEGRVVIAINDKTRPVPLRLLLPPLLKRLHALGVPPAAITLLIGTGTHKPMQPAEFPLLLPPEILGRYRVISHNAEDQSNLVYLGLTSRQTPVWINRTYLAAELRLVVGDIEPHQFMGFSGGVKGVAIGLAGKETITHNHALMMEPLAQIARYEDNPCRQDVEEIGRMVGVHYALNAILNEDKEIVHVLAGDPVAVMEAGIPLLRQIYEIEVAEPFDLMVVAPGGHPKDINLYQAQKALGHAALVTRPGGTVILAAACPEGTGSESYERWMLEDGPSSYAEVLTRFRREGFRIGPHKAFQIARDASRMRVLFLSTMPPIFVRRLLLQPVASLEEALHLTLADLPSTARIGIMPWANTTIPVLSPNRDHQTLSTTEYYPR